jgi:hypothetical protein
LVIADPPSEPAVKLTVSVPSPAVTDVMVGATGIVAVENPWSVGYPLFTPLAIDQTVEKSKPVKVPSVFISLVVFPGVEPQTPSVVRDVISLSQNTFEQVRVCEPEYRPPINPRKTPLDAFDTLVITA